MMIRKGKGGNFMHICLKPKHVKKGKASKEIAVDVKSIRTDNSVKVKK